MKNTVKEDTSNLFNLNKSKRILLITVILGFYGLLLIYYGIIRVVYFEGYVYGRLFGLFNSIFIGICLITSGFLFFFIGWIQYNKQAGNLQEIKNNNILSLLSLIQGILPIMGFLGPPTFFPTGIVIIIFYAISATISYFLSVDNPWGGRLELILTGFTIITILFGYFSSILYHDRPLAYFILINNFLVIVSLSKKGRIKDRNQPEIYRKTYFERIFIIICLYQALLLFYGSVSAFLLGFFGSIFSDFLTGIMGICFMVVCVFYFDLSDRIWNSMEFKRKIVIFIICIGMIFQVISLISIFFDLPQFFEIIGMIYNALLKNTSDAVVIEIIFYYLIFFVSDGILIYIISNKRRNF